MALTQVDQGLLSSIAQYTGFKNRIINGAMMIDQRNAGASITPTDAQFSADRWKNGLTQASKYSIRMMDGGVSGASNYEAGAAPVGFSNSIKVTSLSAYTCGASDEFEVFQNIEANNLSDLNWGTANAKTVTLSFWVKSSLTGTFGGAVTNGPTINYSFPFSYTISAANTWEQKTITIAGPTSGTFYQSGINVGLQLFFSFGGGSNVLGTANAWTGSSLRGVTGQVNLVATNGATLYISGVQLEKGSTATSFDYRPYGTEFQLCQRYYQQISQSDGVSYQAFGLGMGQSSTNISVVNILPVPMRSAPSFAFNNIGNTFIGNGSIPSSVSMDIASTSTIMLNVRASGISTFGCYRWYRRDANAASLTLSAEL